jgi:16S rRNA processing protein RimM
MANTLRKPDIICIKSAKTVVPKEENWIAIGEVRKTVGLQGWLRIGLMTDFPDRFEPGEELLLKKQFGEPESVVVSEWRPHFAENAVDILLEGIDSCEIAAEYVNRLVVIPKEDREELDSDDEFYPDELEGMQVLSPEGVLCGRVLKMEADAPCPYLLVSSKEAGEVMIPFRRDFIGDVDKEKRTLKLVEQISYHIPVE